MTSPGPHAQQYKVTMLFDGDCPMCRREVAHYRRIDRQHLIDWVDINRVEDLKHAYGVEYDQAMARLHVMDANGQMQSGVKAFIVLWQELPCYHYLAKVVLRLHLVAPLERIYIRFARWRIRDRCSKGTCSLAEKD